MKVVKTAIIPVKPTFVKIKERPHEPDLKAICIFAATGFFLDRDTYWKDEKVLRPATINEIDEQGFLINSSSWFEWFHKPRDISFQEALNEFTTLFEDIIDKQVQNEPVILPLSGGLDSRSQALAISRLGKQVQAYSYSFCEGYPESRIARKVAKVCDFPFQEFSIPEGYLWQEIEGLAEINGCYSEFTHARQMAVLPKLKRMEGIFSLGHWGDVLFDRGAPDHLQEKDLLPYIRKRIVKKGGMELATALWNAWELEGDFGEYLDDRIISLLVAIDITNTSAKVRAFKSMYWAPRWTSTNLSVFEVAHPITLPYYDDRMCKFICEIPEAYLADRRLQIAYIKQNNLLAEIPWEAHKPFNLKNFYLDKPPYNLPYRILKKVQREFAALRGTKYIQRNWELQFLGENNNEELKSYLFESSFNQFIPESLVKGFFMKFEEEDSVYFSHSVSILLTLSLWNKKYGNVKKD